MWWWRLPHNPTAYDDDWEDQPAQSGFHQWDLGGALPALFGFYGVRIIAAQHAAVGRVPMELHGTTAVAFGVAVLAASLFLHCHYFWGNAYNQAWYAVLGKIVAACAFIAGLGVVLVRVGVLGRL